MSDVNFDGATYREKDKSNATALHCAAHAGYAAVVEALLRLSVDLNAVRGAAAR